MRALTVGAACLALLQGCGPRGDEDRQTVRWDTSAVGSSGHRAMVALASLVNREFQAFDVTVLPMPGAIMGMRAYAAGDLDGFYGADIAFAEMATRTGRFAGFSGQNGREPVQSFWAYTIEMGLAVDAGKLRQLSGWSALEDQPVFTGPAPWDTRAHLERLLSALGVEHRYVELDLGMTASQLNAGNVSAFGIYTTGQSDLAPWIAEAQLAADLAVLSPAPEEVAQLEAHGFTFVEVDPESVGFDDQPSPVLLSPFHYGFHLGLEHSDESVHRLLLLIEQHAGDLAAADVVFRQLATNMPELQRSGVAASHAHARIHPGLARYMRERGVWDEEWNERVAGRE